MTETDRSSGLIERFCFSTGGLHRGHEGIELTRGVAALPGSRDWVSLVPLQRSEAVEETGFGADYTFEATGSVAVMGQAVEAARMGWGLCTVLGVAGKGEKLEIIPRLLITGRRVQGGGFGGARGRTHVPRLVKMYLAGKIDLDGFVSHRPELDEVNRGFELMEAQDGIRSVITF